MTRPGKLRIWIALLCAAITVFTRQPIPAQSASQSPATVKTSVSENDLVHYGDLLDVDVLGSLEYDWRGTVNPEGFLDSLALNTAPIYALCRSEEAVAADIAAGYSKTLRDPKVVVKILDRSGRAAAVLLGAVRTPQRFSIRRQARLSELLALSGGITDAASGDVTLVRPSNLNCSPADGSNDRNATLHIKLVDLLSGAPEANPIVLSGDIINVGEASPIYVIGGVNTPRPIPSRREMTVTRAISSAGGLAKEANGSDITVFRREGSGNKAISIDLKKIKDGQQEDVVLRPLDIVDVGQKGRPKPKFPPNIMSDTAAQNIYNVPVRIIE
jgi:polysaccharide export outer membrane protein